MDLHGLRALILLNGARDQRPFYSRLGALLRRAGADVHYALDSHYTDYLDRGPELEASKTHYFSEFFRSEYGREDLPDVLRGVPIGPILAPDVDRWRHSHFFSRRDPRYVHTLAACLGHFFDGLFREHQFDLVLYENVSNAFAYMAFEVGRRNGARYLGFVASRLPGRTDVMQGYQACSSHIERRFHRLRRGEERVAPEAQEWLRKYLTTLGRPDYMSAVAASRLGPIARYARRAAIQRMVATLRYGFVQRDDAYFAFQLSQPFLAHAEQLQNEIRRAARRPVVERFYYGAPPVKGPYVLYPTQFHPESSTSVDAHGFEDELTNVRSLSAAMPHGMRLVVRDHPLAAAHLPLHFYEQVRRLPNVDLTGPDCDYESLLKGCLAVVCATSSVGYDALVRGRPVFVLGRPFYSFVPGCRQVLGFGDVHDHLASAERVRISRAEIEQFVAAYYLESIPSLFDMEAQRFREGAEVIALEAIARHLAVRGASIEAVSGR